MTLIDGDRIVTAQLYDDEHEEFTEKKMSIIDYVNTYTDEGVTTDDDILGRIRAEIFNACSDSYHMPVYKLSCEEIFEIIDKYNKPKSEEKP